MTIDITITELQTLRNYEPSRAHHLSFAEKYRRGWLTLRDNRNPEQRRYANWFKRMARLHFYMAQWYN